ncbi:MAG TPA: hypothetical protein VGI75_00080 [Pirellulales bacterium]
MHVQQIITQACREGARLAAADGKAMDSDVRATVNRYLTANGLPASAADVTWHIEPGHPGGNDPFAIVTLTMPFSRVSWLPMPRYLSGVNLTATAMFMQQRAFR